MNYARLPAFPDMARFSGSMTVSAMRRAKLEPLRPPQACGDQVSVARSAWMNHDLLNRTGPIGPPPPLG